MIGDPKTRRAVSIWLLIFCCIGWPVTHAAIIILKPPEASWVFHMLLALSWASLVVAFASVVATTDVRVQEEEETDNEGRHS